MYTVVGCGECHALWVVADRPETTQCPRCRTRHRFASLRAFAEADTSEEAARVRSAMLAERAAEGEFVDPESVDTDAVGMGDEEFLAASGLDPDAVAEAGDRAAHGGAGGGRTRSRKDVVLDALEDLEEPTADAVVSYATDAGVPESYVRRALERLRRAGEVTEKDGVYRQL